MDGLQRAESGSSFENCELSAPLLLISAPTEADVASIYILCLNETFAGTCFGLFSSKKMEGRGGSIASSTHNTLGCWRTGQWCNKKVAAALMSFHTATECKVIAPRECLILLTGALLLFPGVYIGGTHSQANGGGSYR